MVKYGLIGIAVAAGGLLTWMVLTFLLFIGEAHHPAIMWGSYLFCCALFAVGWALYHNYVVVPGRRADG